MEQFDLVACFQGGDRGADGRLHQAQFGGGPRHMLLPRDGDEDPQLLQRHWPRPSTAAISSEFFASNNAAVAPIIPTK